MRVCLKSWLKLATSGFESGVFRQYVCALNLGLSWLHLVLNLACFVSACVP